MKSEVRKTSYGAVMENLVRCKCWSPVYDTVPISLWHNGGVRCTEDRAIYNSCHLVTYCDPDNCISSLVLVHEWLTVLCTRLRVQLVQNLRSLCWIGLVRK